jgi:hypothetical protein
MRVLEFCLAAAIVAVASDARAAEWAVRPGPVDLSLWLDGRLVMDESGCRVEINFGDSFTVYCAQHFFYMNYEVDETGYAVFWNENPKSTHAHTYIGVLRGRPPCITGDNGARMCLRGIIVSDVDEAGTREPAAARGAQEEAPPGQ